MPTEAIHPAVRVGHVHLRVADLDRAVAFYRDGLGFRVSADARPPAWTWSCWPPATTTITSG